MSKQTAKPIVESPAPIPLSDAELAIMAPYLQQVTSAVRSFNAAQQSLDAIAKTIAGRVGAPAERRFKLDLQGKQLMPIP